MNGPHLHLLVNHVPILGVFFALPLLALAWVRRKDAGLLLASVLLLVMSALGSGAALATGEPAEEGVEDLPGVSEAAIHEHEELAELAAGLSAASAAVGLLALWRSRKAGGFAPMSVGAASALAVVAAGAMGAAGWSGGQIRHTELRAGEVATVDDAEGDEAGERSEAATPGEPRGHDQDDDGDDDDAVASREGRR